MKDSCKFNELTGLEPSLDDCDKCIEKYSCPHEHCCLEICGDYFFCKGCIHGIYNLGGAK